MPGPRARQASDARRIVSIGSISYVGNHGAELLRLTDDGRSWAPVWSPNGDQIAYLHVSGQLVDLRLAQLEGTGPTWTAKDPIDLTSNAGLDGASQPDWFVPEDQRVTPAPASSDDASSSPAP